MSSTNNDSRTLHLALPFINILKEYKVNTWKKSINNGRLLNYFDPRLKSTIHELSSSNPNNASYIQLPKFGHQVLKLEGRYFYFKFYSNPDKDFSLEIDCKFLENGSMKISVSTTFEHFKITSIGCRIPLVSRRVRSRRIDQIDDDCARSFILVEENPKWMMLCIDLQVISDMLGCKHSHIKKLKISGDVAVDNMFVSEYLFVPRHLLKEVMTPLCYVLPDEMNFKLCDDSDWKNTYAFVCFPQNVCTESNCRHGKSEVDSRTSDFLSRQRIEKSLSTMDGDDDDDDEEIIDSFSQSDPILDLDHVIGFGGANAEHAVMNRSATMVIYPCNALLVLQDVDSGVQKFMIGHTNKISCLAMDRDFLLLASAQAGLPGLVRLWSVEMLECLAVVHPGMMSVCRLGISRSGRTLCCVGKDASLKNVVVVWDVSDVKGEGLCEVICKGRTEVDIVKIMMLMTMHNEGRIVSCGQGNIRLWRSRRGRLMSTPVDLAGHHSESFVDVVFESEADRSEFTESTREIAYDVAYACTKTSLVFEVDMVNIAIIRVVNFGNTPPLSKNPATSCVLLVTQNYICLGGSSGRLKMWTTDASVDLYEVDLCSPVKVIRASNDCVKVLVGREDGGLGLLDLRTRQMASLQSSVGKKITNCSLDVRDLNMCTISADGGVRLWSLFDMSQPTVTLPPHKDLPTGSTFHPRYDLIFIGYISGRVGVFGTRDLDPVLEVFNLHDNSAITTLTFNEDGTRLFSCSASSGKLIMHRVDVIVTSGDDDDDEARRFKVILGHVKTLQNTMASEPTTSLSSFELSMSPDKSLLAHVGSAPGEVFVRDSLVLKEIARIEMSKVTKFYDWKKASVCHRVIFSSRSNSCLIIQSGDGHIYNYDYLKNEVLNQWQNTAPSDSISLISTFQGTDNIAITSDKIIKVFRDDSYCQFQLFIGHSEAIRQMCYDPTRSIFVSVGDALFVWNFNAVCVGDVDTDSRVALEELDFANLKRHFTAIRH